MENGAFLLGPGAGTSGTSSQIAWVEKSRIFRMAEETAIDIDDPSGDWREVEKDIYEGNMTAWHKAKGQIKMIH